MDLDKFKTTVAKHGGKAVQNRFNVIFTPPERSLLNLDFNSIITQSLSGGFNAKNLINDPRDISLLCQTVNIPGRTMNTFTYEAESTEQKNDYPYEMVYDDCSMKFMCTNDMYIRKMFDKWFDIIYNPTTNRFGLKDDYSVDVVIQMLNKQDIPVYGVKLLKAFPVKISGFDLTQDKEALVEVQIDWKYDKFETEGILSSSLSAANAVIDLLT